MDTQLAEILKIIQDYDAKADTALVESAYNFAKIAHQGQLRISGEPYINHPIEVAEILADLHMDRYTLAAALLHDTVEDTQVSLEELKSKFGAEVAGLVDGVTKLTALSNTQQFEEDEPHPSKKAVVQAENIRKLFLAMARDIRVMIIKLADRLHNLRTLESLPSPRRKALAKESQEIFAPIASRLGIWKLKAELEDLAFKFIDEDKYQQISKEVERCRAQREVIIETAKNILYDKLKQMGIKATIDGRAKHIYSVYQKMLRQEKRVAEIYDLIALRVIVDSEENCYAVLGAIHSLWIPFMDRIKDFIAAPKPNQYRSLHTSVSGPNGIPIEIQIRTKEMHWINEYGIAAHWAYKEGKLNVNLAKDIYPWLRHLLDWQKDSPSAQDYVKNLKVELLKGDVFVFSPKGEVIDLPAGSGPLDFAYRVHTDIGHRCTSARVNTKMVPLDYTLQNADIVEIITGKIANPSLDWLKIVKSSHAQNKIRQWFKKKLLPENIQRGKDLIANELRRTQLEHLLNDDKLIDRVLRKLGFSRKDDLFAAMGYGDVTPGQFLAKLKDEVPKAIAEIIAPSKRPKALRKIKKEPLVRVEDIGNILVTFSKCCSPVPGDLISGYITIGKGVSVHRTDCPNLAKMKANPDRQVRVQWTGEAQKHRYQVELRVDAWDRSGILAEVMATANRLDIPVITCLASAKGKLAIIKLQIEVVTLEQLNILRLELEKIQDVIRAFRTTHFETK